MRARSAGSAVGGPTATGRGGSTNESGVGRKLRNAAPPSPGGGGGWRAGSGESRRSHAPSGDATDNDAVVASRTVGERVTLKNRSGTAASPPPLP